MTTVRTQLDEIDRRFADAQTRFESFAETDLGQLATNGWTVRQLMEHLALNHGQSLVNLRAALDSCPPSSGDAPFAYHWWESKMFILMGPKPPFRMPVPSAFDPQAGAADSRERCLQTFVDLRAILASAKDKDLSGAVAASPINARIRLRWITYLEALARHAQYHAGQLP